MLSVCITKLFIALLNKRHGVFCFYSLLKTFDLEERVITEEDTLDKELINKEIDFEKINSILEKEKAKTECFFKSILN